MYYPFSMQSGGILEWLRSVGIDVDNAVVKMPYSNGYLFIVQYKGENYSFKNYSYNTALAEAITKAGEIYNKQNEVSNDK